MNNLMQITEQLKKSKSIAIFTHINPDGDALGSAFSMKEILSSLGKKAVVYLLEQPPKKFSYFITDYEIYSENIKSDADTALAVDCGAIKRLAKYDELFNSINVRLCIDHHFSNSPFGDVYYSNPEAAATCEIIYEAAKALEVKLNTNALEALFTGISTDTGHFKYSNVSKHTMLVAADLIGLGIDHRKITTILYDSIKISKLKFFGAMADKIEMYYDNKISVLKAYTAFLKEYNLSYDEVEELPSIPLNIDTVHVSILIKDNCETGKKVSLRGKDKLDLSEIASKFGGGGHKNAAAFVTNEDIDEIIKKLVGMIEEKLCLNKI